MYVCGITPYDSTHLGHAATYVAFDLLNRVWRDVGHRVHYVQNVTDVDDPLLERAAQTQVDWEDLAASQVERFRRDMTALRVLPPDHYVGAVESIPQVIDLVERLRSRGAVYDVDGDLYFPVSADPEFGSIGHLDTATMIDLFGQRGGDPDRRGKKDQLDCLLWQQERPGEPSWDAPFGRGRPGWHIECTAIALHYLGMSFDVQGGGSDLIFPHHEMCAAEAHVALGEWPFARSYVHSGMVGLDGKKMSKSEGNLVFVSELLGAGHDPMAIRLAILSHHYRSDWSWTSQALYDAEARLTRWREAVGAPAGPSADALLDEVRSHLASDLDAPAALLGIDRWVERTLRDGGADQEAPRLVASLADALLGVSLIRH